MTTASTITVKDKDSADVILQTAPEPFVASDNFTTTTSTSARSASTLIANSATAGSVTPLTFTVARNNGGYVQIERARLKVATDTGWANQPFILKLYRSSPTCTNGDSGAWLTTEADYIGDIPITTDQHFSDFEKGVGVPNKSDRIIVSCNSGVQTIYGLLVTGAAMTAAGASKTFTVVLEGYKF